MYSSCRDSLLTPPSFAPPPYLPTFTPFPCYLSSFALLPLTPQPCYPRPASSICLCNVSITLQSMPACIQEQSESCGISHQFNRGDHLQTAVEQCGISLAQVGRAWLWPRCFTSRYVRLSSSSCSCCVVVCLLLASVRLTGGFWRAASCFACWHAACNLLSLLHVVVACAGAARI